VPIAGHGWDEDLQEIVAAEKLGFTEVWIAEHFGTPRVDLLPCADLLVCKAAALTKRIRLGPGIRTLPLYHPVQVATQAAVCDHLTDGRYLAGVGTGGNLGDVMQQLGVGENSQRHARMHEALDLILKCWTETEPFDYEGRYWQCKNVVIHPKPLQKPHMPVGIACSRSESTLELAGAKGLLPLVSFHDAPAVLREMADVFERAARAAGRRSCRADIRVPRYIHVADSVKRARAEVRDALIPMIELRKRTFSWQFERWLPPSGRLEDVTFDYMADVGAILVGDPETVYQGIKAAYDEIGGFGVLLLIAGKDVATRQQRFRSWRLFMQHVAPRLADLEPDRRRPLQAVF
jgi:alkanesulfonate monooxygenase SsuD/methylene tetrahydromethanopterin reductase-like flavin-dependent oxidoreductase (luciferase family)